MWQFLLRSLSVPRRKCPVRFTNFDMIQQEEHAFIEQLKKSTGKVLEVGDSLDI